MIYGGVRSVTNNVRNYQYSTYYIAQPSNIIEQLNKFIAAIDGLPPAMKHYFVILLGVTGHSLSW